MGLTLNRDTRKLVGVHIGDRSGMSAQALWHSRPPVYRQCAVCDSDFWEADHTMAVRSLIETVQISATLIQQASCFRIPTSAFRIPHSAIFCRPNDTGP